MLFSHAAVTAHNTQWMNCVQLLITEHELHDVSPIAFQLLFYNTLKQWSTIASNYSKISHCSDTQQ